MGMEFGRDALAGPSLRLARMLAQESGLHGGGRPDACTGIGANTAIFSLIDAVMLRRLPVRDHARFVVMRWRARRWPRARFHQLLW